MIRNDKIYYSLLIKNHNNNGRTQMSPQHRNVTIASVQYENTSRLVYDACFSPSCPSDQSPLIESSLRLFSQTCNNTSNNLQIFEGAASLRGVRKNWIFKSFLHQSPNCSRLFRSEEVDNNFFPKCYFFQGKFFILVLIDLNYVPFEKMNS